jgi:hypothetical protein
MNENLGAGGEGQEGEIHACLTPGGSARGATLDVDVALFKLRHAVLGGDGDIPDGELAEIGRLPYRSSDAQQRSIE